MARSGGLRVIFTFVPVFLLAFGTRGDLAPFLNLTQPEAVRA